MVAIKPPSLRRAEARKYYRNIAVCCIIQVLVIYGIYSFHLEQLSVETADAAFRQIERQAEERMRDIGIPIPDYEQLQDDTDQALAYVRSFKSLDRSLKFFHIPKTAGTAIEDAAGAHQIPWGSCLFPHKPKRDVCQYPKDTKDWPIHVGYWHLPRFLFPACDVDPYQRAETFGVVREPYDRMVSEFYYICTLKVFDWRPDQCKRDKLHEAKYMNHWLSRKIEQNALGLTDESKARVQVELPHPALQYLGDNGHFTPQYDFIVGPNQVRYVDFVLTLEHLADRFGELMAAFGLDKLTLKKMNALGATSRDEAKLTTAHLSAETINLMHQHFENDFLFGYPKRTEQVSKEASEEADDGGDEEQNGQEDDGSEGGDDEKGEEGEGEEGEEAADDENEEAEGDDQAAADDDGKAEKKQGLRKKKKDEDSK